MKFDDFKALKDSNEYADNLLTVLDKITEEALEKLCEDFCEDKPSIILKKIYPRFDFKCRDDKKFEKFQMSIYGVIRRFSSQIIEELAGADIYSEKYRKTYRMIANFFGNESKSSIKQPRAFPFKDMNKLFEELAERTDKKRKQPEKEMTI